MPTYIKTGYWDSKAKAPKEWLDLNLFVQTHGGGTTNLQTVLNTGNVSNDVGFTINDLTNGDFVTLDTVTFGLPTLSFNNFLSSAGLDINYGSLNFYNNFTNKGLFINTNTLQIQDLTTNFYSKIDYSASVISTYYENGSGLIGAGIFLDFANDIYQLGTQNGNVNYVVVSDNNNYIELATGVAGGNTTTFKIDDNASYIKTFYTGDSKGLNLDFGNDVYKLGSFIPNPITNVATSIEVDNNNSTITTFFNDPQGLKLDFFGELYSLGDFDGIGNTTFLTIDNFNEKLIVSNNLKSPTAGSSSGQYLEIRIGSTDYKIALLNP